MELLLSSPVPIVSGVIFVFLFIGIFLYELRNQRRERSGPPQVKIPPHVLQATTPAARSVPPASAPPPVAAKAVGLKPKRGKGTVIIAFSVMALLLSALAGTVYLVSQKQQIFNLAFEEKAAPEAFPTIAPTRPSGLLAQSLTITPLSEIQSVSPTVSISPILTSAGFISCLQLTAAPSVGKAPLSVTFTGEGKAPGGTVTAMQFVFGDGNEKVMERKFDPDTTARQQVIYTYRQSGIYRASLRVRSDSGAWSDTPTSCVASITVNASTSATPTVTLSELPKSGGLASVSATPIVVPKTPAAGNMSPTLVAIMGAFALVMLGVVAMRL